MRKIDKSKILSGNYKKWLKSLGDNKHPKYNSSKFKFYQDIKMSLLHSQNGLCAYTEQLLCDEKYISTDSWDDEKYSKKLTREDENSIQGDLDHFDESLKTTKAWSWDNFFVVATHNNCRIKGNKPVYDFFKPDDKNYDPNKYLEFDFKTGVFIANKDLADTTKSKVTYMIQTLGLNCIYSQRKQYLQDLEVRRDLGLDVNPYQYMTAWSMYLGNL